MRKLVVVLISCLTLLPLDVFAKEEPLVSDVTLPENTIVKPTDHVQIMYTIRLDALNGKKEATVDLPVGVILQKKSEQLVEDDRGNKGAIFFEDDVNQLHFVFEEEAYFYKNKTMTLRLPVLMDDVTVGTHSLVVHTAAGDQKLPYTIEKMKAAGELDITHTVEGAFIHWTVKAYTKKNTYRAARFVSTLSDDQQLEGQVHVKYQSLKTGTSYDEFFTVRPTAANEMKLNLGDLDERKMTIMFKTKVTSPSSLYTNDVALLSTNQSTLQKQGTANVAESAIDTTVNVTKPTSEQLTTQVTTQVTSTESERGKVTNEDIIVTNDGETELTELPQTGERATIFAGAAFLAISSLLVWKRRKIKI
ncbi:LPXTG cell wall anchor domain-containing protein [Kurthia senegalensis]|uniref:LPXTG cell wall anchor domain-containing protein n=1 Tax=Kurthia senegalensis TaxID=1033740 RepID=UPI0002885BA7|nr:LPXTG cell wall anchor domain-containing protein [Kurthia senegalensis]